MGYRWRRFVNGTLMGRLTCSMPRCGEERVGLSIYCREHTDAVLSPKTLALLRSLDKASEAQS